VRRAARVVVVTAALAAALTGGCGAIDDAVDRAGSKPDDKPEPAPLTLPPVGPPTSEFQATPSDPVRAYCAAVDGAATAMQAGDATAIQAAFDQLAAASEGLVGQLGPQDAQTIAACTEALQEAITPIGPPGQ
jgi:hypothetical protein